MSCLICAGAGMTGFPCPDCGKVTPNVGRVVVLAPACRAPQTCPTEGLCGDSETCCWPAGEAP